ncbi:hypothetical protein [Candidatus Aalborgicola defluviihabitans]|uniref:hypothetical protein n=1 Tax=Candidatus Aalborgicola defluviihabitans TaxID=3386187 RepID=UPI001EB855EE|nr:hypothetical protein [Burkholderiales bacterium]
MSYLLKSCADSPDLDHWLTKQNYTTAEAISQFEGKRWPCRYGSLYSIGAADVVQAQFLESARSIRHFVFVSLIGIGCLARGPGRLDLGAFAH